MALLFSLNHDFFTAESISTSLEAAVVKRKGHPLITNEQFSFPARCVLHPHTLNLPESKWLDSQFETEHKHFSRNLS